MKQQYSNDEDGSLCDFLPTADAEATGMNVVLPATTAALDTHLALAETEGLLMVLRARLRLGIAPENWRDVLFEAAMKLGAAYAENRLGTHLASQLAASILELCVTVQQLSPRDRQTLQMLGGR